MHRWRFWTGLALTEPTPGVDREPRSVSREHEAPGPADEAPSPDRRSGTTFGGLVRFSLALLLATLFSRAGLEHLAAVPAEPGEPVAAAGPESLSTLRERLRDLRPDGHFVVVDSADNRLRLYRGEELLLDAVCSTGTGSVLRDHQSGRAWVFDTPIGVWRVREKRADPVWVKPDWAFIEEGESPPADPTLRYDDVSLGEYGLYLGDGYIIHGTLFESLLGQPATHGCIRVGADDLERLYREVPIGAPVILY